MAEIIAEIKQILKDGPASAATIAEKLHVETKFINQTLHNNFRHFQQAGTAEGSQRPLWKEAPAPAPVKPVSIAQRPVDSYIPSAREFKKFLKHDKIQFRQPVRISRNPTYGRVIIFLSTERVPQLEFKTLHYENNVSIGMLDGRIRAIRINRGFACEEVDLFDNSETDTFVVNGNYDVQDDTLSLFMTNESVGTGPGTRVVNLHGNADISVVFNAQNKAVKLRIRNPRVTTVFDIDALLAKKQCEEIVN